MTRAWISSARSRHLLAAKLAPLDLTETRRSALPLAWFACLVDVRLFVDVGLFVQDHIQQRGVDFYLAVVTDESQFPEFVHEEAHAGSCGSDHIGERFLANLRDDGLGLA